MRAFCKSKLDNFDQLFVSFLFGLCYISLVRSSPATSGPRYLTKRQNQPPTDSNAVVGVPPSSNLTPTSPPVANPNVKPTDVPPSRVSSAEPVQIPTPGVPPTSNNLPTPPAPPSVNPEVIPPPPGSRGQDLKDTPAPPPIAPGDQHTTGSPVPSKVEPTPPINSPSEKPLAPGVEPNAQPPHPATNANTIPAPPVVNPAVSPVGPPPPGQALPVPSAVTPVGNPPAPPPNTPSTTVVPSAPLAIGTTPPPANPSVPAPPPTPPVSAPGGTPVGPPSPANPSGGPATGPLIEKAPVPPAQPAAPASASPVGPPPASVPSSPPPSPPPAIPQTPLPGPPAPGPAPQPTANLPVPPPTPSSGNSPSATSPSQTVSSGSNSTDSNGQGSSTSDVPFSALPPATGQNSTDEFTSLPPAPGQNDVNTTSTGDFTALPPGPGQDQPTQQTSSTNSTSDFTGLPPAPGQSVSSSDGTSSGPSDQTSSDLLENHQLPISHDTWVNLKIDDILMEQNITINAYARNNKGGNFICGIGENCNAGQPFHPIRSPAWQILYAAQEYNHFMNAMFDSVKYTMSTVQSTSAAMINDLFEDITDSSLVLDLKWVFTDLYRGIAFGAISVLLMAWLEPLAATVFILHATAFAVGLTAWIQGTPKTVTYKSWTELSLYLAELEDQILSSLNKSFSASLEAPINSDQGLGKALMGGTFFQPTTTPTAGMMDVMEKNTMRIFMGRVLSRMLRQSNAFVTIGQNDCKGAGPGGAWGGNDQISYCDPEAKLLYNVIRAHKKKSINTIYGASAIIHKYGFSAEYITKTSWECQQKYGRFEHDVYADLEHFPTEVNSECAINLPVCDTRLQDVRELREGKKKTTVVACRNGAGLPI